MTVSTTINKISYTGNGVAKEFAVPFPFLEKAHLKVYQLLRGVRSERTDWTMEGGNLVFAAPPVSDAQIVIIREIPFTQETDYRENEILAAETLERNFDKLTMAVQQLAEESGRSVKIDVFSNANPSELVNEIEALYAIKGDIVANARNAASIGATAADITNVNAVSANIGAINAVADVLNNNGDFLFFEYVSGTTTVSVQNQQDNAGFLFEEL